MRLSAKRPGWLVLGSGRQLSRDALFWLLQSVGWLAFGLMMLGYLLAWETPRNAVIGDIALVSTGIGLTSLYRILYHRLRGRTVSPFILIFVGVTFAVAGSPTWYLLQGLLSRPLSGRDIAEWQHPFLLWSDFNPEVGLYYVFILLTWTLLYFGINGWMSLELERRRADRAEASAQSARLKALQAQLEPHFLFNTLNGISSLVAEGRNDSATAMIARLSDFLRLTLQTAGTPEITLANELIFVRQYLDIQQLRFGERLRFEFAIAPKAMDALVPALLLQPLVENAVRHGILPRAGGGRVIVSARTLDGRLLLDVEDDGPGIQRSASPSSGLGLSNTATRLTELYGGLAEFAVGRSKAGGAGVAIRIPLHADPDAARQLEAAGAAVE
jgi:two-component system, LytTR family, sensor kinase